MLFQFSFEIICIDFEARLNFSSVFKVSVGSYVSRQITLLVTARLPSLHIAMIGISIASRMASFINVSLSKADLSSTTSVLFDIPPGTA